VATPGPRVADRGLGGHGNDLPRGSRRLRHSPPALGCLL